ncbi:MAG TPA: hypothetical protein VG245_04655 [Candidatus Dormibacteraeota bacterium]|jgi:hypothetical protein|nr:hypothetical protein [Candidatus Dormibacteraeota bacterium]
MRKLDVKLGLNRETVRELGDQQTEMAFGGVQLTYFAGCVSGGDLRSCLTYAPPCITRTPTCTTE